MYLLMQCVLVYVPYMNMHVSECVITFRVLPLDGRNRIALSRTVQYHSFAINAVLVFWLHHKFGRNCKRRGQLLMLPIMKYNLNPPFFYHHFLPLTMSSL